MVQDVDKRSARGSESGSVSPGNVQAHEHHRRAHSSRNPSHPSDLQTARKNNNGAMFGFASQPTELYRSLVPNESCSRLNRMYGLLQSVTIDTLLCIRPSRQLLTIRIRPGMMSSKLNHSTAGFVQSARYLQGQAAPIASKPLDR